LARIEGRSKIWR